MMEIRKTTKSNLTDAAELAVKLWPGHEKCDLEAEFAKLLEDADAAIFLAVADGTAVGFAQCQLRHDYVEGTESSPVGYLEGIYVRKSFQKRGIAKSLLSACENWAKEKGCEEFASDCELTNTNSLAFHLNVGFKEANRIICFTKKL